MQRSHPFTIRPAVEEHDFGAIAAIMSEALADVITEAELHEWEARRWEGMVRHRLVADDGGQVAGYGLSSHRAWDLPGWFEVWVAVPAVNQGQGIGAALYEAGFACARENGATVVTSEVKEGDDRAMRFAVARGFRLDRHVFDSQLDLTAFDESRFSGVVEAVEAAGIRFFSLAERDTPEIRQGLYEVNRLTAFDIPGYVADFPTREGFDQMIYRASWYIPEGQILAADGDKIIGLAALGYYPEKGWLYNNMTGVLPEYRGRKIALALKLLAIRTAKQKGARWLRTSNDSLNAPMLAINRKLGYQPEKGILKLIQPLTSA